MTGIWFIMGLYLLAVWVVTWEISRRILAVRGQGLAAAQADLNRRIEQKQQLTAQKKSLDQIAADIFTLYDMTKEIAKHLNDEEAVGIFKSALRENFFYEECLLLDPLSSAVKDLKSAAGWTLFPLRAKATHLGFLAVKGVPEQDKEKLLILANQFALALQRVRLYAEVEKLAMTDSLTEVHTRRYIMQRLEEERHRAEARKTALSFLMIDVDHFKLINDRHGHLTGDLVLREVARIIRENIREIDICGRYGGEEFGVVLPDTGADGAIYVAERIRLAIEKAGIQAYDANLKVTVSVGAATLPQDGKDLEELLDKADWAMYQAKKHGRNSVHAASGHGKVG